MNALANLLVLPVKSSLAKPPPQEFQGSHRGAPWSLQAAPREPHRCPMGPPGSRKGATAVAHGTSRQPQGLHEQLQMVSLGVRIWVSDPGSPSPGLRIRALDHEEGIRVSDPGSPSSGLRIRASETECLILGVKFWQSDSGRSNLGVSFWESDHRSPSLGVGSPITGVNLGVRSWASDPRKPRSGVQIEKDTLSDLFGVSRWGQ